MWQGKGAICRQSAWVQPGRVWTLDFIPSVLGAMEGFKQGSDLIQFVF